MAARLRKTHQDDVRSKIKVSQLINVLTNQALGESENEISPTRLKAIEILLRKSLPDLSAIQFEEGPKDGTSIADLVRAYSERRTSDPAIQG